jgi:hypothetical protein
MVRAAGALTPKTGPTGISTSVRVDDVFGSITAFIRYLQTGIKQGLKIPEAHDAHRGSVAPRGSETSPGVDSRSAQGKRKKSAGHCSLHRHGLDLGKDQTFQIAVETMLTIIT